MAGPRSTSFLQSAGLVLALLPVALLPQVVGGVHPEAAAAFAVVELVALALWWGARAAGGHSLRVSWLALPFLVGAVATLLQVVPLPEAVLDVLQGDSAVLRRLVRDGLPAALQPRVAPVTSLDPAETKAALLRLLGATALVVVVADGIRDRHRSRLAWRLVLAAGALVITVAVAHVVVGAGSAWGSFSRFGGILYAPIVNPNHLSKILGGFALLGLGRALSVRGSREAIVAGAVFMACGTGVALTLSRGGILAFIVALLCGAALAVRARALTQETTRPHTDSLSARFAVPALSLSAVLVVVIGVIAVGNDAVVSELATLEVEARGSPRSKLTILGPALELLTEHSVVGVGNNAFGVGFTAASRRGHLVDEEIYFSHPENIVVAALVEHGVVVGGLLLLLGLVIAARLVGSARSPRLVAALPAVALLVVGDMVDFALETGAGLALMATALALSSTNTPPRARLPRAAAAAILTVAAVVVAMVAPAAIDGWKYRLDAAVRAAPLKDRTATLQAAVAVRPFDAVLCSELAIDARQRHEAREALAWANRALNLWPTFTPAHLEAARALAALGHLEQSMLQYREAAAGRTNQSRTALPEAFARTPDVALRERALPDTADARLQLCRLLEQERRLQEALVCADRLAVRTDASATHRVEPLRLAMAAAGPAGTNTDGDDELRRRVVALTSSTTPPDGELAVVAARAMVRLGGREAALTATATWSTVIDNPGPLLVWRLGEQAAAGAFDDARATLGLLRPLARTPADRDQHDRLEASLCEKAGDHGQRLVVMQRLAARHPGDAELLAALGLAEVAAGKTNAALQTLRRLRDLPRPPPSLPVLERALGQEPRPPPGP